LAEGKERALLIDTGCGIGNLKETISTLTSLPVTVVATHGHPDHVLGGAQFDSIHLANEDAVLLNRYINTESRKLIYKYLLQEKCNSEFSIEQWLNSRINIIPVNDGHIFDLGDRIIRAVSVPGHSAGCIALIDEQEKLLFSGDSIQCGDMWIHLKDSFPLHMFLKSIHKLRLISDKFYKILPGHSTTSVQTDIIDELIQGITKIVAGELKGVPHSTFMGEGLHCRFNRCGVVYNPNCL
jgi:glyoxylase-like metal-dependent hydrolase (beta-lactamase superfamily II)